MNKKILITGAQGFTGRHACLIFKQLGYQVKSVVRGDFTNSTKDILYCNLTYLADVEKVIQTTKPDFIIHLAGKNHAGESWKHPDLYMDGNITGTINLLEAVRKYKPDTKIAVVGSMLETSLTEEKPNHPYGLSKSIQSTVALAWYYLYQLSILVVRPPNLIGPGNSTGVCSQFGRKIVEAEKNNKQNVILTLNKLGLKRAFLDVRDAVSIYAGLLENGEPGKIYDLVTEDRYSLQDIVKQYKTLSHCSIETDYVYQDEQPNARLIEADQRIFGERIEKVKCPQKFKVEQSLSDILDYYRKTS
mgnify:CR=1 FL=1